MLKLIGRLLRNRRGAALLEYSLLIAGVALVSAAAISTFGHKTSDLMSLVAAVIPGAHNGDNAPIQSGHLLETDQNGSGSSIELSVSGILAQSGQDRLGQNLLGTTGAGASNGVGGLVVESE